MFQACMKNGESEVYCNRKVTVKDVVLANYYILLVTNLGLYVSSRMTVKEYLHQSRNNLPKLSWTRGNAYTFGLFVLKSSFIG